LCASRTINDYQNLFKDAGFVRIRKSFLVYSEHLKEHDKGVGDTMLLTNNFELDVSRRKKEEFIMKMKGMYKY
jgi:two-component system LytT family response regulator